jgi:putative chitinase
LTIQISINLNIHQLTPLKFLSEDGRIGTNTINAIKEFQSRVVKMNKPDGRVDPNGKTLKLLKKGFPNGFSEAKLRGIYIHAPVSKIKKSFSALKTQMEKNDIKTPLRMAHFLAQVGHESGELRYTEEIASGEAYEGRKDLGNTQKGDGVRFKGRGLIQLTGRANYESYGKSRGRDFTNEASAKLVSTDANLAVDVACWFWNKKGLNKFADADNVNAITKRINGGFNGLKDRKAILSRAKFFLVN